VRRFENKVVLVTGASRGIGLATVERFAREGATVIATDIEKQAMDSASPASIGRISIRAEVLSAL